jgi:hypothetical protein
MRFTLLQEATQMLVMATRLLYQLPRSVTRNPLSFILTSAACKCFHTHSTNPSKIRMKDNFSIRLINFTSRVKFSKQYLFTSDFVYKTWEYSMLESFKYVTVDGARKIRGVSSKVCVILQKLSVRSKQSQILFDV